LSEYATARANTRLERGLQPPTLGYEEQRDPHELHLTHKPNKQLGRGRLIGPVRSTFALNFGKSLQELQRQLKPQPLTLAKWREDIREGPIVLDETAANRRSKALVWAAAIVSCDGPHRDSRDIAVRLSKVQ
jgi:hypothetical protein